MSESADLAPIREAVRALCADFPGEYWRALDRDSTLACEFAANMRATTSFAAIMKSSMSSVARFFSCFSTSTI